MPLDVRLVEQGFDWLALAGVVAAFLAAGAAVITTVVVVRTARYARDNLNEAKKTLDDAKTTRHAQLVTDISRRWDEPALTESDKLAAELQTAGLNSLVDFLYGDQPRRRSWRQRRRYDRHLRLYVSVTLWPSFLESIGCLHAEGAISDQLVYRMWGARHPLYLDEVARDDAQAPRVRGRLRDLPLSREACSRDGASP